MNDLLYMYVAAGNVTREGDLQPSHFINQPKGMSHLSNYGLSSDWCKYARPHQTLGRKSGSCGVISILASNVYLVEDQFVEHDPIYKSPNNIENNQAHTNIKGPKAREDGMDRKAARIRRALFVDLISWEIGPIDAVLAQFYAKQR